MFRLVLIGTLAVAAFGARLPSPQFQTRGKIIGGEGADIEEVPYHVAILYNKLHFCGASVLSATVAISAAQCVIEGLSNYLVRGGTHIDSSGSGESVGVSRILVHEDYNENEFDYDVSLFFLSSPLTIDGVIIAPITLPAQGQVVPEGTPALVTGWGPLSEIGLFPVVLQKVTIPIANQTTCIDNYAALDLVVSDRMICAGLEEGGVGPCQDDAGGPLVIDSQLIGITSWGNGCARAGFPGVWTRVPFFVDWINQNAGLLI